jgi:AmmeMemoRadiSam system protein A
MHLRSDLALSDGDRLTLLALARKAILETISSSNFPDVSLVTGRLAEPQAAFVTLRWDGKLRGCIGQPDAAHGLAETVVQCAITAALRDPRFGPLRTEEIDALQIEISVISEPRPVRPEEIELGTHGIVVTGGGKRGLLLPQVALERNWSLIQFLEAICRKAGLQANAWREPNTKLFAFTAEVFSDAGALTAEPTRGKSNLTA